MLRAVAILAFVFFAVPVRGQGPLPSRTSRLVAIRVHPSSVLLDGKESRQRIVVDGVRVDGRVVDVTSKAVFEAVSASAPFRIAPGAILRPHRDGVSELIVDVHGLRKSVLVSVRDSHKPARWTFANHVESVLSKRGCNMGACHGAGAGKGGLRLSLRAYDPELDYKRLRLEGSGRRIVKTRPESSLLLRKPSLATSHVGGLLLKRDSLEYRVVRDWIATGAPGPSTKDPTLTSLRVYPTERLLDPRGKQQLQVTAVFSDGRREDVTHWARYISNEEPIAKVDEQGLVTMAGYGETAITVWYLGKVTFARMAVPFGNGSRQSATGGVPATRDGSSSGRDLLLGADGAKGERKSRSLPDDGLRRTAGSSSTKIDSLIDSKLARLRLAPSPTCSDGEFIRRAFLDTIGTLPTTAETRAFLTDRSPRKRERLVDALLERPELADYWTYRWADVLRINRDLIGSKGMSALYGWLRNSVAQNRPWDRIAYDLITASGSSASNGPANFYRMGTKPEEFAETVSQTFLGIRVQCAHCHNHPFEKWTQSDYYRMANFFGRVSRKQVGGQEVVLTAATGDVEHPRLGRPLPPAPFDGPTLALSATGDRREFLAEWTVSPQNPYFARTLANRIWKQFMGRGLVEPVDDMRLTNPASNEPLLRALSAEFASNGFDAKRLARSILLTRAYQRSARPVGANRLDDRFYSRYLPRRIPAEALLDAVSLVTGSQEKFVGVPAGMRAISLPDTRVASDFLDVFGRPARQVTCECERNSEPNMAQALHLITAATLNGKISARDGALNRIVEAGKPDREILDELYLSCFSRTPTAAERAAVDSALRQALVGSPKDPKGARLLVFGDLLWALLSAPEFVYNH